MQIIQFMLERVKLFTLLIIIGITIQVVLGKFKWQYYSLYLLVVLYFAFIILNYFDLLNLSSRMSKWIIVIAVFLLVSPIMFSLVFPTEKLPIPSGGYKVATRIYDLKDDSRAEIYTDDQNDKRKIKYQVWYPTDDTGDYNRAKWITEGTVLTRRLAKSMHVPRFMLDHTAQINSNSYINAPISNALDNYPIVIISHGWKGFRELHTDFAEELASNGFIAISIDHTYGAQAVKIDNNDFAYLNKNALPSTIKPGKFNDYSNKLATTFGDDVISVLNDLEQLNNTIEFNSKLNLNFIGLLGHSTGGGGDVYAALKDKRIKAIMGLDAWVNPLQPNKLKKGLHIPSLFLRSEQWSKGLNNKALNNLVNNSKNVSLVQMDQTNHVDFAMTYMYSPLTKYIGFTGQMGGRYSSNIQREFILGFFNQNLRDGQSVDNSYLNEIVSKYDNLKLITKKD